MMRTARLQRTPVSQQQQQKMRTHTIPAPVLGWVANESLAMANPGGALVLENFFPTRNGARLRGGSLRHATIGAGIVESLLTYRSGAAEKLFAAANGFLYDVSAPTDAYIPPVPLVTGRTSNDYSFVQFATAGGDYMIAVNGTDKALTYNGTAFDILDDATTKIAFDAQTANYTVGLNITGGTSGATAVIVSVTDNGTTGTLRVKTVVGTFVDNEIITDSSTGSATSNIPTGVETIPAITGAVTSTFSHVWSFKNRIFYVKSGTKTAVYMPVDSIGGAASEFTLDGVFRRGGSLLFGATWSLDAGDGLDDKCVFISTNGEAAIYQGSNPGDANDWSLVGRYDISKPMGKNGTMQAGGDLLIACVDGLIPLSEAINKDPAALSLAAVSRKIEPVWKRDAFSRSARPWGIVKWPEKNMAIISAPAAYTTTPIESDWGEGYWGSFIWGGGEGNILTQEPYCYVINLETGSWTKYSNWDVQCVGLFNGYAYFGTADGKVMQAEVGGNDDGHSYVCRSAGMFETLNGAANIKQLHQARATWTYGQPFNDKVSFSTGYVLTWPAAPDAAPDNGSAGVWDVGTWDDALWDTEAATSIKSKWVSIGKTGYAVSPMVQVTCGGTVVPDAELVSIDLTYESGGVVV